MSLYRSPVYLAPRETFLHLYCSNWGLNVKEPLIYILKYNQEWVEGSIFVGFWGSLISLECHYTPIRFRAQTLSSAITGGFKYAKLHLIYSHTMIQAVHGKLYLFTLHKMLNSLLLCSRMAPSNGDLYVLQTESVYTGLQYKPMVP